MYLPHKEERAKRWYNSHVKSKKRYRTCQGRCIWCNYSPSPKSKPKLKGERKKQQWENYNEQLYLEEENYYVRQ